MHPLFKKVSLFCLALFLCTGCATTYVPVSWGVGEKVDRLTRSDLTLAVLFNRYDPDRTTLRVAAQSFGEVMMPSEVKSHLGAYRADTKLIYRNLYREYTDKELRDLLAHEFAHHVWFTFMTKEQQARWRQHLHRNPSPLQLMVRSIYQRPTDFESEDFAFVMQAARPVDIEELAAIGIITADERDAILKERVGKVAASPPAPAN